MQLIINILRSILFYMEKTSNLIGNIKFVKIIILIHSIFFMLYPSGIWSNNINTYKNRTGIVWQIYNYNRLNNLIQKDIERKIFELNIEYNIHQCIVNNSIDLQNEILVKYCHINNTDHKIFILENYNEFRKLYYQ